MKTSAAGKASYTLVIIKQPLGTPVAAKIKSGVFPSIPRFQMLVMKNNFPTESNVYEESHFAKKEHSKVSCNKKFPVILAMNPGQRPSYTKQRMTKFLKRHLS